MYRHRIHHRATWGWEILPAPSTPTTVEAGAIREALEESGWEPQTLAPLCRFFPANGVLAQTFHIFVTALGTSAGDDTNESRNEWFTPEVRDLLRDAEITDG
jgi:8-oxo-dGTP pyrophosphatase MutT (NUDIX family)